MIHMVRGLALMVALTSLVGCVSLPELAMSDLGPVDGTYVRDESVPDRYPGVALAEGNIYSCRFGIAHINRDRIKPPVADTFGALLAKEKPEIVSRHVVLERFDVYRNYRLRVLSSTQMLGGAVFAAVAASADKKNNDASDLERFSLRANPGNGRWNPKENQVGCDGREEGEYYASEVNGGHDVIVIWLRFRVDGKPYSFRSAYQYQFDEAASPTGDDKVKEAIALTVAAVADEIDLQAP